MILLPLLYGVAVAATPCQIPVYLVENSVPLEYAEAFDGQLARAISVWNGVGAGVRMRFEGSTENVWIEAAITVGWSLDRGVVPMSIANSYRVVWPTGGISKSKVELLSDIDWCHSGGAPYCVNSDNVLLHELGHALGLDHRDSPLSVMRPQEPRGHGSTIVPDDEDAVRLRTMYPADGTGCGTQNARFLWNTLLR